MRRVEDPVDMTGVETTDMSAGTEMTDRSREDKEAEGLSRSPHISVTLPL
jgi:hypothetical protein